MFRRNGGAVHTVDGHANPDDDRHDGGHSHEHHVQEPRGGDTDDSANEDEEPAYM